MLFRGTDRSQRRRLELGGLLGVDDKCGTDGGLRGMLIADNVVGRGFLARLVVSRGLFGRLGRGEIAVDADADADAGVDVGVGGGPGMGFGH